jgi:hypothetical protein
MKKHLKRAAILLCVFFCISLLTYFADSGLADQGGKPIFSVPYAHVNDGGSTGYLGLGYQIIKWHSFADQKGNYYVGVEKHYLIGIRINFDKPSVPLQIQNT